ncbi:MFS transporter [Phytobacter diazotrophicus]|uniref:MFS transporter n=1 Tax=Phytobacter diazotrophicus TaxID=395631 RepID=UPI0029046F56|nr:MFS transporter [Phytobacter diazotrophicus]MDU1222698.1 MFS transporter [Citrobacter freundii]MDU7196486.1 MFS transporter [Enterobacteriaceae bacterium]MDV2874530.1 MFS transporter [Phytobacter diazotrophicus]
MNTLLFALVRALRTHRWLRLLLCAFVLSSLGNGLTQVLVFGQLLRWHASPSTLTLAYLLATLPGFVGSLAGEKVCRRLSPLSLLIITELLGMVALALPLFGLVYHSIPALLMVQSAEALLGGMSWPALALVFKRGLTHDELPAATGMESVIFASQVLLGTGVGVLLFDRVAPLILLSIDALSFLASVALLMLTRAHYRAHDMSNRNNGKPLSTIAWPSLTAAQKRSLLILPALAAVGSPAMALLPALAQQIHPDDASGLALPLLFARSLGQLCGPLLLNGEKLPHYARRNRLLVLCLAIFLGAYGLLPLLSEEKSAALGLIFIAHLASNVVFAVGTFSLLAGFSGDEIPAASAKAWRWQTLTATLMTTIAAWLASEWGAAQALYSVSLSALLLMSVVMARYRE